MLAASVTAQDKLSEIGLATTLEPHITPASVTDYEGDMSQFAHGTVCRMIWLIRSPR